MTEEKPKTEKPFRGFLENATGYYIGDKSFDFVFPEDLGLKLHEWRGKMQELVKDQENDVFTKQELSEELAKEILTSALKGFDYMEVLKHSHPKELEGSAGEIYTFLYEFGSRREIELSKMRLQDPLKNL